MAEEHLVTNIVAKSDFSSLIGDLNKVSGRLVQLQEQLNTTNKTLAVQAANMQKAFSATLRSTGQFSTHFVSLQSDVDKFGKSLDSGRMKLGEYYGAWREHARTSGGLVRDLAKQQVMMQNAILQPLGKNAQGLMQFNVQVPRGLDVLKNKTAVARQEMMIMNKVIQDGANQVINWGKNTQWAGRQLTVGLTLPITMFGKAAADAFKQADEQLVRLTKVYGGVAATSAQELAKVRREVSETARELSAAYGASYNDTIGLAADIAATGKQGADLIKSTQETTRLAVLGEVDRQEAMKATLAIQTAFGQNTEQLAESINFLNAVENQTSTSLADLVEAIPKAGPVVQAMGGSIKDLALYMTAMREGGINASEGANALKSALASIINPTKVAKEMFQSFGIDLGGIVTKNAGNLTGTILAIQDALNTLDPLSKQQAIEQLFGKFQFARMNALFENLGKQGSQTLQVLDLMKATSQDLSNIAGRELSQITESASGKYKRAIETLKADMAGVGEQFLGVATKIVNVVDSVLKFFNNLPDPIKNIIGFVGGLTALTGPIIMLTGLMANFFGYIAKGLFHFKALLKGGEGFKLLTPELLAAEKASSMMATSFYDDAKAAAVLKQAIAQLSAELSVLESKANGARVALNPTVTTVAGSQVIEGARRVADPSHPLIGAPYTRAFAHLNPVGKMTQAEREAQTIFGVVPNPGPLNRKIGMAPQAYMSGDLPVVERVTGAKGYSTGVVADEAAKWHAMTGALSMQSKQEIALLKTEVAATGTITSSLADSYKVLLPKITNVTAMAADETKLIVTQLKAGKLTVDQAQARIVSLNAAVETMIAETTTQVAAAQGRVANLRTVPLTSQPVVDPVTGKSNMKELFHKGPTATLVDKIARNLGVRTSGGGYSIATTKTVRLNNGGYVYDPSRDGNVVPGDTSINYDNTPAILNEGGFILNQGASRNNPDLVSLAKNGKNEGGKIVPALLTPGETYFPPSMAQSMMPTLEAANSGQKIQLRNMGGSLGGTVSRFKHGYGNKAPSIKISADDLHKAHITDDLSGLMIYLPKNTNLRLKKDGNGVPGNELAQVLKSMLESNINPNSLMLGASVKLGASPEIAAQTSAAALQKLIYQFEKVYPNHIFGGKTDPGSFERMARGVYKPFIESIRIDPLKSGGNRNLFSALGEMFTIRAGAEISQAEAIARGLIPALKPGEVPSEKLGEVFQRKSGRWTWAGAEKSIGMRMPEWAKGFSALATTYTGGGQKFRSGLLSRFKLRNSGGPLGGTVHSGKHNYGLYKPVIGAGGRVMFRSGYKSPLNLTPEYQSYLEKQAADHWAKQPKDALGKVWDTPYQLGLMREGKSKPYMYPQPKRYYQDLSNDDPAHGALQIGRYEAEKHVRNQYVAPMLRYIPARGSNWKSDGFTAPAPVLGSMEERAKSSLFRYMQGDYSAINEPAVQQYLSTLRTKFTGRLHRGVDYRSTDSLPPFIKNLIKEGKWEDLIGKEFIMRRASWSKNPKTAQGFGIDYNDSKVGQVILTADVKNRNAVPASELFPDLTFQTPKGPMAVNESEVYMGGKFRIVGAGKGAIKLEAVYDGKREHGGPVNAGRPYLVGEKGPELFVPKNNGGIIPHYALGGVVRGGKYGYGNEGPMRVEKFTTTGRGGVRTNAYGMVGSPAYLPALGLPGSTAINATGDKMSQIFWQKLFKPVDHQLYKIGESFKGSSSRITSAFSKIQSSLMAGISNIKSASTAAATIPAATSGLPQFKMPRYFGVGPRKMLTDQFDMYKYDQDGNPIPMSQYAYGGKDTETGTGSAKGAAKHNFRRSLHKITSGPKNMLKMPKGGFKAGGMGTWIGGGIAGEAIGSRVGKAIGGESGGMMGGIVGGMALPMMISGLSSLSMAAAAAGSSMSSLLAGMLGAAAPFAAVAAIVVGIGYGLYKWRQHLEDVGQAHRAVFGASKKTMEEVGLSYKSATDRLKDHMAELEMAKTAGLSIYEQNTAAGGGTGIKMSIDELKKGVEDAKKNAKETLSNINNVGGKEAVVQLAASMKQQYISAGMSVQEATNKVYTLIKASDKGAYAFAAVTSKAFNSITDQSSAATYSVKLLVDTMKAGSVNAEEMAVGIDNMLVSLMAYQNSLVGTKDINGNIIDQQDAQLMTLKKITSIKGAWKNLDSSTIEQLKSQDLILGSVLNKNESLASVYAKQQLVYSGYGSQIDIYGMSKKQAVLAAQGLAEYQNQTEKAITENKTILGSLNKSYVDLTASITLNKKVAESKFNTSNYDAIIKKQGELIKKIKEETAARLKALDVQEQTMSYETQLKREQLAYQQALASGDMVAAANARLNLDQLVSQRQSDLAKDSIQASSDKRVADAEAIANKAQTDAEKQQIAAQKAQTDALNNAAQQTAINSFRTTISGLASSFVDINSLDKKTKNSLSGQVTQALKDLAGAGGKAKTEADSISARILKEFSPTADEGKKGINANLKFLDYFNNAGQAAAENGVFKDAVAQFLEAVNIFAGSIPGLNPSAKEGTYANPLKVTGADLNSAMELANSGGGDTKVKIKRKDLKPEDLTSGDYLTNVAKSALGDLLDVKLDGYVIYKNNRYKAIKASGEDNVTNGMYYDTDGKTKLKLVRVENKADGGHIRGAGTKTSDSIPAMLSNGEYVIKADSVSKYGVQTFDALNAQRYATGGMVSPFKLPTPDNSTATMPLGMNKSIPTDIIGNTLFDQTMLAYEMLQSTINSGKFLAGGMTDNPNWMSQEDEKSMMDWKNKWASGNKLGAIGPAALRTVESMVNLFPKMIPWNKMWNKAGFKDLPGQTEWFLAQSPSGLPDIFKHYFGKKDEKNPKKIFKYADGGLVESYLQYKAWQAPNSYIDKFTDATGKVINDAGSPDSFAGGDGYVQKITDDFTQNEAKVAEWLHGWVALLNTYYGGKYEGLFKGAKVPGLLENPILPDLKITDPRNLTSALAMHKWGIAGGARAKDGSRLEMLLSPTSTAGLGYDATMPSPEGTFANWMNIPEGQTPKNWNIKEYSDQINKKILTEDSYKMSVLQTLFHEYGHILQMRILDSGMFGKGATYSKIFKDSKGYLENAKDGDITWGGETSADYISGNIMAEMFNAGYLKDISSKTVTSYLKSKFSIDPSKTKMETNDGVHPSDDGYRLGTYVKGFLAGNLDAGLADFFGLKTNVKIGDTEAAKKLVNAYLAYKNKVPLSLKDQDAMPDFLNEDYGKLLGLKAKPGTVAPRAKSLKISTPDEFGNALITLLGGTTTPEKLKAIRIWAMQEGGHWNNKALYNPLNTTLPMDGSKPVNIVNEQTGTGVQAYKSWEQGLSATAQTLKTNSAKYGYDKIIKSLVGDNTPVIDILKAINASSWGAPKYNFTENSPSAYNPNKPFDPKQNSAYYSQFPDQQSMPFNFGIQVIPGEGGEGGGIKPKPIWINPWDDINPDSIIGGLDDRPYSPDNPYAPYDPSIIDIKPINPDGLRGYNPLTQHIDSVNYAYPLMPIKRFESGTLQDASNNLHKFKTRTGVSIVSPNGVYRIFNWKNKYWAQTDPFTGLFGFDTDEVTDVQGNRAAQGTVRNVIDRPFGEKFYFWGNGGIGTQPKRLNVPGEKATPFDMLNNSLEKFFLSRNGETGFKNGTFPGNQPAEYLKFKYNSVDNQILKQFAMGGLVTDTKIPKFEKGINMVPADMLALLHKNEAVVPANMNPFNPNANANGMGTSTVYTIAPVINAAPGMDEQALVNMATRQVFAELKSVNSLNNATMGRQGMRVIK